jgi:hypothetical protein
MKLYNAPFAVVIVSMVTPWVANLLVLKFVTYAPVILAVLFVMASKKFFSHMSSSLGHIIVFLLVIFHVVFSVLTGRGIGSGGTLIIYFLAFLFYYALIISEQNQIEINITRYMSFIYLGHLIALYIELIICLAGFQNILIGLGGSKKIVNSYKSYNHADFIHFIGFPDVGGLASLLLGSQSASMLSVIGFFYFVSIYKGGYEKQRNLSVFALLMVPFTSTMTSLLMMLLMMLYSVFVLRGSKIGSLKYRILTMLTFVILNGYIYKVIFFKITNIKQFDHYYASFYEPISRFMNFDVVTMIMGEGARGRKMLELYGGEGSDFGLMTLINQTGIYLMGMSLFLILYILYNVNIYVARFYKKNNFYNHWCKLAAMNAICIIGWYISLLHYSTAVEVGGRELFALHIAVCVFSLRKLKQPSNNVGVSPLHPQDAYVSLMVKHA